MKFKKLDQETLKLIDSFFNSNFSIYQINERYVDLYNIFPWTHNFNSEDIKLMFEDLQKEINLHNYIPNRYLKSPIKFLNYIMSNILNLKNYYLKPFKTHGIFRLFYLEYR